MRESNFPEQALAVLRLAQFDAAAGRSLELLSGSFIWDDECYLEFVAYCRDKGCRRYHEPVVYRTSLILGRPDEESRRGWEELLRLCPSWPGFRPERRSESLRPELERAVAEEW